MPRTRITEKKLNLAERISSLSVKYDIEYKKSKDGEMFMIGARILGGLIFIPIAKVSKIGKDVFAGKILFKKTPAHETPWMFFHLQARYNCRTSRQTAAAPKTQLTEAIAAHSQAQGLAAAMVSEVGLSNIA